MDLEQATAHAREAASATPADRLLERLAELIAARAGVQAVFGEPIRQDVVIVVPVARVRWGFGGGGGRSEATPTGPASGSGGGGGVAADPVGYLEIGPGGAAFRPIREPYPSPVFLIASGLTAALVIRALVRLVRPAQTRP
jgi:Sporulation protein YtfJ (Spore_YtfJ)